MTASSVLSVALTIVFVLTGAYGLVRYARLSAARVPGVVEPVALEGRAAELLHVLMSVAMIAMVWGAGGGPDSGSGVVQLVVFGGLALAFGARLVVAPSVARVVHVVGAAAMVWMVAAMPALMGGVAGGSGGGHNTAGMADMPGMAGMSGTGGADGAAVSAGPAPAWVVAVSWVVVVALAVVAVVALSGLRPRSATPGGAGSEVPSEVPGEVPSEVPSEIAVESGGVGAGGGTAVLVRSEQTVRAHTGVTACCHALMSAGMAVMLAVMV